MNSAVPFRWAIAIHLVLLVLLSRGQQRNVRIILYI